MLKIYVTRHGQDMDNKNGILNGHRDEPLTPIGEQQARNLATKIREAGLHFDAVYSSPLQRAHMTALILSEMSNQPRSLVMPELIERNFGVMTGVKVKEIEKICAPNILKTSIITYFLHPEGAETFPDLLVRAGLAINLLKKKHSDGSILVVTHGDFGKMMYAHFYGLPWRQALVDFHFGNSEVLCLAEGCDLKDAHLFKTEQHNH